MRYPAFTLVLMTSTLLAGSAFADGAPFNDPMVVKLPAQTGERVLLYPGGQYGRIIPWGLKQPGTEPAPIHIHRPASHPYAAAVQPEHRLALHRPARHSAAHSAPAATVAHTAPKPVVKTAKKTTPKPVVHVAKVAPKPAPKPVEHVTHVAKARPAPAPKPAPKVKPEHHKSQMPVRVAKAEPAPRHTHTPFYARRGNAGHRMARIAFQQSASQPSGSEIDRINALAGQLDDAITGRSRVQILAYAGPKNSRTSLARRLSLKRALIVRQLLIDNGVPSDRIDVRAMGGVTDNGASERVDIYLKN